MQSTEEFLKQLGQATKKVTGAPIILDSKSKLFYGISDEDLPLWKEFIEIGDDISIQNILKAKKAYLLTHVIGNPSDLTSQLMRNNEAHYGNIALHNRIANSHDESILKISISTKDQAALLASNKKGADYLLRYYELKQKSAKEKPELAKQKIEEIETALCAKDIEGKTPFLLACKTGNQVYAKRLLDLDVNKKTLDSVDKIEKRTPLHIACILGLDIAHDLIKLGARQDVDDQGHLPSYYLTCSEQEKKENIAQVLESVNFFYGRYFNADDKEKVVATFFKHNQALQKQLAEKLENTQTTSHAMMKN